MANMVIADQIQIQATIISVKDIKDGKIEYSNARQIMYKDFIEVHRRTRLEPLDVLITNSGTIGRTAVIRQNPMLDKTTFQKSVAIVKPKKGLIDSYFLKTTIDFNVSSLINTSTGSSQKNLLLGQLRKFVIPLPPLSKQRRFATFVNLVDKQKMLLQSHLKELDTLFAALQQRAFNGEL